MEPHQRLAGLQMATCSPQEPVSSAPAWHQHVSCTLTSQLHSTAPLLASRLLSHFLSKAVTEHRCQQGHLRAAGSCVEGSGVWAASGSHSLQSLSEPERDPLALSLRCLTHLGDDLSLLASSPPGGQPFSLFLQPHLQPLPPWVQVTGPPAVLCTLATGAMSTSPSTEPLAAGPHSDPLGPHAGHPHSVCCSPRPWKPEVSPASSSTWHSRLLTQWSLHQGVGFPSTLARSSTYPATTGSSGSSVLSLPAQTHHRPPTGAGGCSGHVLLEQAPSSLPALPLPPHAPPPPLCSVSQNQTKEETAKWAIPDTGPWGGLGKSWERGWSCPRHAGWRPEAGRWTR